MSRLCIHNGLNVKEILNALFDLTGLENQLIAPYLLFMQIQKVPKSGIHMIRDRVVLVSVEPCGIMNTIEKLCFQEVWQRVQLWPLTSRG